MPRFWEKPLGLILPGGGSLGSWQAGCLKRLSRELEFDHVVGFSIGALNGAAYCFGRMEELPHLWRDIGSTPTLRLKPRFRPLSLFSDGPLRRAVQETADEVRARQAARCRLTVISLCRDDGLPIFARFSPQGRHGWDSPLAEHLVASCSIPVIFPPVRLRLGDCQRTLIDGGVRGKAPLNFDILEDCRQVLVLEMFRPDEFGRRLWNPFKRHELKQRKGVYNLVSEGLAALKFLPEPPAVYRFFPSKILDFPMLSFKSSHCAPAFELGQADAERLLADPASYRTTLSQ